MSPLFFFLSAILLRALAALSSTALLTASANSDAKVILFSKSAIPSLIFLRKGILLFSPCETEEKPCPALFSE